MKLTYVFCLMTFLMTSLSVGITHADEPQEGFRSIFDGQSLNGWTGKEGFWKVVDGAIVGETSEENRLDKNTFLVWNQGSVDDFELRLKFRISGSAKANSGIQFRGTQRPDGHVVGYQADIDRGGEWVGALYDEAARGILAKRGQKTVIEQDGEKKTENVNDASALLQAIDLDGWNDYSILAQGNHITLKINGKVVSEVIDHDRKGLDRSGLLALQLHTGPPMKIEFKEIRLKRLPLQNGWKKVVFIAGKPSHAYSHHEHNAGCLLLAKQLQIAQEHGLPVVSAVYLNGWPNDVTALDNADTVVAYCDGGERHFLNPVTEEFDELVQKKGIGLVCLHYGVETTPGAKGDYFLKWIGGFFEPHWSVNPHWVANFETIPEHAVTRGVNPFEINDEWYYHMRFVPEMKGVTPVLTALPPRESLTRKDGPHSGNPHVRAAVLERGEPQHTAWVYERPEGKGRGFGFTGGHYHANWQHDDFRKLVLNAIVWTAGGEVPKDGVATPTPSEEEMQRNHDGKRPEKFRFQSPIKPKSGASVPEEKGTIIPVSMEKPVQSPLKKSDESGDVHHHSNALRQLDIHPELKATLFASEPMFSNPTSMDIDHLGRVWVCEGVHYRRFANKDLIGEDRPPERLLILEDTNQDGVADKTTIFYQGQDINAAQGVLVLPTFNGKGTRALISHHHSIFYLIDDDGDLKADRKEILFTGIGESEHDHGVHAVHFGPDGKLYFNFGNTGKRLKDKDGNLIVDKAGNPVNDERKPYQEGMVFRCNLDGSEVETLGWNFRNNWEACIDSYGNIWQSDNDDDGHQGVRINYVMEFGNYGYRDELTGASWQTPRTNWESDIPLRHWHLNDPGVVPNLLQTGAGAPTGICFYEGDLLPKKFRGAILHCDAGANVCRAYVPKQDGAGFKAEIIDLLESRENKWFRPSDICVAPDGSVLISDWYDGMVGGHRMQDGERGRIFRLTPLGDAKYVAPTLDLTTPEGAVKALQSPNMATRYLAWTTLEKFGEEAATPLLALFEGSSPVFQARALWLLGKIHRHEADRLKAIRAGLVHPNPDVRVTAIRLLRQEHTKVPFSEVDGTLQVEDRSFAVLREMLIALRDIPSSWFPTRDFPAEAWTALAKRYHGDDRWYLEALGIAADGKWDEYLSVWMEAVGDDWKHVKAGRDIVWRSRSQRTPELLVTLIDSIATPTEELPRYFRAFDFQNGPAVQEAIRSLLLSAKTTDPARKQLIRTEALARIGKVDLNTNPQFRQIIEEELQQHQGTTQFVTLVKQFQLQDRYPALLALAQSQPESQLAVDAMKTLFDKEQGAIINAALKSENRKLAEATFTALGTAGDNRGNPLLLAFVKDESAPLWARQAAVKALGRSHAGAAALLKICEGEILKGPLVPALAATLTGATNQKTREAALKIFPPPPGKNSKPLPPINVLAERKGNAINGRIVFNTNGTCNKCHQVNGIGVEIGPNLSEIGKKLARPALFEAIIYPSAAISHGYENWLILTADGQVVTGLLVSETSSEIQIKDDKGLVRTIPIDDIENRRKQDISLMPADLQRLMSVEELVDVVEYMTTLQERKR